MSSKINLVVIGHKDHGKSTMIGRLLYDSGAIQEQKMQEIENELKKSGKKGFEFAFLLDSLEEERKGGLTIDIIQMPFRTQKHMYTIIDCPGHRELIRNMMTGASQAEAAILVVSAEEGVQDQTKQHLFLIKTLGIKQLVIAVNKMDQIDYDGRRFKELSRELRKILKSLGYEDVQIIPVSALNGDNVYKKSRNMAWYDGLTLIETLDESIKSSSQLMNKPLRCCVQDIYQLEEEKIVICKIETGILKSGRKVVFNPSGKEGFIKKIEMSGKEVKKAEPGESVGLTIDGIEGVKRGEVVSYIEEPVKPVMNFFAEIILFSNIEIKNGDVLTIRCGTAEIKCKVQKILEKIDPINLTLQERFPGSLKEGDIGKIAFSASNPIAMEKYSDIPQLGRFVIEGKKGTAAAGIVLEVEDLKIRKRN